MDKKKIIWNGVDGYATIDYARLNLEDYNEEQETLYCRNEPHKSFYAEKIDIDSIALDDDGDFLDDGIILVELHNDLKNPRPLAFRLLD